MSKKPYELPLKIEKFKNFYDYTVFVKDSGNNIIIRLSVNEKQINQLHAIVTAVNAYPALVAENEGMRKAIGKVMEYNSNGNDEDNTDVIYRKGYAQALKNIQSILSPAVEGVK